MLKNSLSNAEVTLTIREYVEAKKLQQFQVSALLKQFNILRRQLGDKKNPAINNSCMRILIA